MGGERHLVTRFRFRIYILLWTTAALTHFSWQSFDFSVVCLKEEILAANISSNITNKLNVSDSNTHDYTSLEWLGPAFASWSIGTLLCNIPAGYLIDRFGVRFVLGFGTAVASLLNCLIPVALENSIPALCFLRFLIGATTAGVRYSSQNSVAGKWAPLNELGFMFGVSSSFSVCGSMLANCLGAALCTNTTVSWRGLFYTASALQAVWVICWFIVYRERPEWHPWLKPEEIYLIKTNRVFKAQPTSAPSLPPIKKGQQIPWKYFLTSRPVWAAAIACFSNAWLTSMVVTYGPTFFHTTTTSSLLMNSIYASMPLLGNLIVKLLAGFFSDLSLLWLSISSSLKFFNGLAFLPVSVIMLVGSLTLTEGSSDNAAFFIATFTFMGANIAGSFKSPVLLAPRYAGMITGSMEVLSSCGAIVAVNSIAALTPDGEAYQWRWVFAISSGLAVVASSIFIAFGSGERQEWADPNFMAKKRHEYIMAEVGEDEEDKELLRKIEARKKSREKKETEKKVTFELELEGLKTI